MIIGNFRKLRSDGRIHAGDTIWGCEFSIQSNKESAHLVSKPTKGMIAAGKTEKEHLERMQTLGKNQELNYFVPFKKDGTPAWSRAVSLYSRHYATNEEDCKVLYNERVASYISWLDSQILWAREQLVPARNPLGEENREAEEERGL